MDPLEPVLGKDRENPKRNLLELDLALIRLTYRLEQVQRLEKRYQDLLQDLKQILKELHLLKVDLSHTISRVQAMSEDRNTELVWKPLENFLNEENHD